MLKAFFDIFMNPRDADQMYDTDSPFAPARAHISRGGLARDEISGAILSLALPPDAIVTEAALTQRFALSLAATRAALARLAEQGWVSAEARRGWRIMPVTGRHLADLTLARRTLEPALRDIRPRPDQLRDLAIQGQLYDALLHLDGPGTTEKRIWQDLRLRLALADLLPQPRLRLWLIETWQMCARADLHLHRQLGLTVAAAPMADLLVALSQDAPDAMLAALSIASDAFAARADRALAHSDASIGGSLTATLSGSAPKSTPKRRTTPPDHAATDRRTR